jgi:hypothetical protein
VHFTGASESKSLFAEKDSKEFKRNEIGAKDACEILHLGRLKDSVSIEPRALAAAILVASRYNGFGSEDVVNHKTEDSLSYLYRESHKRKSIHRRLPI